MECSITPLNYAQLLQPLQATDFDEFLSHLKQKLRIYGEMKPEQKNSLVQEIMDFVIKNFESIQICLEKDQTEKKFKIFSKKN